jgi:hypothetical protein
MMVEKAAVGRGRRREKEGEGGRRREKEGEGGRRREKKRESARNDQTASMAERAATPLSIYLSDPQGRDKAIAQEGTQNSVKRRAYSGTIDRR